MLPLYPLYNHSSNVARQCAYHYYSAQSRLITIFESHPRKILHTIQHLSFSCRNEKSVVNHDHRVHGVKNLFVVDGSSFVTSGRQQPTCTIHALAYRAADLMAQAARRGEL